MYGINETLQANYIHSKPYGSSSGSLRVYIPSLMPLIAMGIPKITPVSLNTTCFCNASDCKPAVANKIDTQNYVTAEASYTEYKQPCYYYGSSLKVNSRTEDCLTCRLNPSEEDNSSPWPY